MVLRVARGIGALLATHGSLCVWQDEEYRAQLVQVTMRLLQHVVLQTKVRIAPSLSAPRRYCRYSRARPPGPGRRGVIAVVCVGRTSGTRVRPRPRAPR